MFSWLLYLNIGDSPREIFLKEMQMAVEMKRDLSYELSLLKFINLPYYTIDINDLNFKEQRRDQVGVN